VQIIASNYQTTYICWFDSNDNSQISYQFQLSQLNNLAYPNATTYLTQNYFPTETGDLYLYQTTNQIAVYNFTSKTMIFLTSNKTIYVF
jgi:hypothetical protein